jgi:hypothetical protein
MKFCEEKCESQALGKVRTIAVNECKDAIVKMAGNTSAKPFTAYYGLPTPCGLEAGQFKNGTQQCQKCF